MSVEIGWDDGAASGNPGWLIVGMDPEPGDWRPLEEYIGGDYGEDDGDRVAAELRRVGFAGDVLLVGEGWEREL